MPDDPEALFDDPEYVQGQIDALHSLILGLAECLGKDEFRFHSLERLEALRAHMLTKPVSDRRLLAIDKAEAWLKKVTE